MEYRQIQAPDVLKDHVRFFWTLNSDGNDGSSKSFAPVADGCPGLIFQHSDAGAFYQNEKQLPDVFVYGQTTRSTEIHTPGKFNTIGIYFYPHALKSIFGINAYELTDGCVDVNVLAKHNGTPLSEQLANASSVDARAGLLTAYLSSQVEKNRVQMDAVIHHAVKQIILSKGGVPMKDLHEEVQLSERSFERRFKQFVGIPPKLFSRICRFQSSLQQLKNNNYEKLSDIAFENGFADQSHFIRVFKEFAGHSPFQYQKQSNEIINKFPHLLK